MAFDINEMRSELSFGGARPTLFYVELTGPAEEGGNYRLAPFHIRAASLPESTINPIEVPYYGRKIKVAGDRVFDMWNVTVMNDEDFPLRDNFEKWHNRINTVRSNLNTFSSSAPNNYKSTGVITQLGKTGNEVRKYRFNGLFPIQISPIEMDWEATDQIEMFNVTFAYDWYDVVGGTTGTYGG